jgi:SAM-dependent methyltransferase
LARLAQLSGRERLLLLTPGPHGAALLPALLRQFGAQTCVALDSDHGRLAAINGRRVLARATRLPFARHSFDALLACEALYSIRPPWTMLAELHRVLAPGGKLVLLEPARHGPLSALRDALIGLGQRVFSMEELKHRLTRAGFDVASAEETRVAELSAPVCCVQAKR